MKILKFYAEWCGPCKMLSKTLDTMKEQIPYEIVEIDVDNDLESSQKYGIRGVPTMIMVDGDTEVKRQTGNMSAEQLKQFVGI